MYVKLFSGVVIACIAFLVAISFKTSNEIVDKSNINGNIKIIYHKKKMNLMDLTSSVTCHNDKTSNKICTLRNACYLPESNDIVLVIKNESVIIGLNSKEDLKTISMSSVNNHNNLVMRFQIVIDGYSMFGKDTNVLFIDEPVLLMSRFKPDNIMHVIHDDVMPVYMTYEYLCSGDVHQCVKRNHLMFTDDGDESHNQEWYRILSYKKPYSIKNFRTVTCFDTVFVGLLRESLWFQYGFGEPQGPLNSATINSAVISRFKTFVFNSFKIDKFKSNGLPNAVVLSRKSNRRILNEDFLVDKLKESFKTVYPDISSNIKVDILDVSQNKSTDILSMVSKSKLLVGMHGSAMIYSIFLPENTAIVELFPFGIQPQHVSAIRALTQLVGINFNYLSWRNFKETNSFAHPHLSPLLGGIQHLPKEEQDRILSLKLIPAVHCCHDPAYLYRMYQDTIIDENFPFILKQVLINQKENSKFNAIDLVNEYLKDTWYFPGSVFNVSCVIDKIALKVTVKWYEPLNVDLMNGRNSVIYYVTVKINSRAVTFETYSHSVMVKLSVDEKDELEKTNNGAQVWVKTIMDNIEGYDIHFYCS